MLFVCSHSVQLKTPRNTTKLLKKTVARFHAPVEYNESAANTVRIDFEVSPFDESFASLSGCILAHLGTLN